jgi:hypothetical protein
VYLKNVIIFIIRVLKLLVMQGKYILLALVILLVIIPPGGASLNKITAGAPVFIGETNVDISRSLDNCRVIAWWPDGADTSKPPGKNITLRALNEISDTINHYSFTSAEYGDYTGTWYCEEKKPLKAVFVVKKPEVKIRVWDRGNDKDVTGMTIPSTANVTYRIDTNLDSAMDLRYRPDITPADSFWTVKLTNPAGLSVTNIYTGSYGAAGTVILTLDSAPRVTRSPYLWESGSVWNRASRNIQGELVYPPGTYTFTASQNLNGMQAAYKAAGITDTEGSVTSRADVTFTQAPLVTTTPTAVVPSVTTPAAAEPVPPEITYSSTPVSPTAVTTTPVPVKTTYQPLPEWIALAGVGIAAAFVGWQRR